MKRAPKPESITYNTITGLTEVTLGALAGAGLSSKGANTIGTTISSVSNSVVNALSNQLNSAFASSGGIKVGIEGALASATDVTGIGTGISSVGAGITPEGSSTASVDGAVTSGAAAVGTGLRTATVDAEIFIPSLAIIDGFVYCISKHLK